MKPAWKIAYSLLESLLLADSTTFHMKTAEPTSIPYLRWMCHEIINNRKLWESDKSHRWIGYIQGVMCAKGWSSVEVERDRVRAIGHD
jgi:hypothetical protein